jgi:hypothetical protein
MDEAEVNALIAANQAANQAAIQAANQAAIAAAVAQAQAANQGAIAAAVAQALAGAQAAAPPPAVVVFTQSPAVINVNNPWDWTSANGAKLYATMMSPLATKFSGKQEDIRNFMSMLEIAANAFGWTPIILTIPQVGALPQVPPVAGRDMFAHYGMITIDDIRAHAYGANGYVGTQTRAAQAAEILAIVITKSMADIPLRKLMSKKAQFYFDGTPNGPLMLKTLLSQVLLEARSTIANLHKVLFNLPDIMVELDSDIVAFNLKVDDTCNHLLNLGERPTNLFEPLFSAYLSVPDSEFKEYIKDKRVAWIDDNLDLTPESLMQLVEGQYKSRVLEKTWNVETAATRESKEIIALKAELKAEKANNNKKGSKKQGGEAKQGVKKTVRKNDDIWAWKEIAPTTGQPKEKTFRGKVYIHCPHHPSTQWVLKEFHLGGCKLDPKYKGDGAKPTSEAVGSRKANKNLAYARALMSAFEDADDDDDDDDEIGGEDKA